MHAILSAEVRTRDRGWLLPSTWVTRLQSAMTPTEEETWDRHRVDLQASQSCVESVTLLGTLIASIWGGGRGVWAVWHRWVGLDNPESHWDFSSASWRAVGFVLSVLHGLAGVTDGATDAWDRCVALS